MRSVLVIFLTNRIFLVRQTVINIKAELSHEICIRPHRSRQYVAAQPAFFSRESAFEEHRECSAVSTHNVLPDIYNRISLTDISNGGIRFHKYAHVL